MKGYYVDFGYMGYISGRYMLFASESDYNEYVKEIYSDESESTRE